MTAATTHEAYIQSVRAAAVALATLGDVEREGLLGAKLVYGRGERGLRGVTCYDAWQNGHGAVPLIEVCAAAEEGWVQLAGTTLHECGHSLAGLGAGHGQRWVEACEKLGLRAIRAAGTEYKLGNFAPGLRFALAALPKPADGAPQLNGRHVPGQGVRAATFAPRPCSAGIGTRGGKSRGVGSGSRLRKWVCACERPVIVRVASDAFAAHCDACGGAFRRG